MEVSIYRSEHGTHLVLVPACFLPGRELLRRYGPVRFCGSAQVDDGDASPRWQRMLDQIDRQQYALIRKQDAAALLGDHHPCVDATPDDRRHHADRRRVTR